MSVKAISGKMYPLLFIEVLLTITVDGVDDTGVDTDTVVVLVAHGTLYALRHARA